MGAEEAQTFKDQGNAEYKAKNYLKAAGLYTKGIKEDPDNAVLYSNRCECLLQLKKVSKALQDADDCIRLKPDWEKGFYRKGAVLEAMERFEDALVAYQQALELKPDNKDIQMRVKNVARYIKKLQQKQGS